jgi:hypothetical protein
VTPQERLIALAEASERIVEAMERGAQEEGDHILLRAVVLLLDVMRSDERNHHA